MLVWLASLPRSGNTYVRMLMHWCTAEAITTYSVNNDPIFDKYKVSSFIGQMPLPDMSCEEMDESGDLYIVKTHAPARFLATHGSGIICVVRDPRDMILSTARYRQWRMGKNWLSEFRRLILESPWSAYYSDYMNITDCVVRYEDAVSDPISVVSHIINTLDLPLTPVVGDVPTFQFMHSKMPDFFRAGVVGGARSVFTPGTEQLLYKRFGHLMNVLGYERYEYGTVDSIRDL